MVQVVKVHYMQEIKQLVFWTNQTLMWKRKENSKANVTGKLTGICDIDVGVWRNV